MTAVLKPTAKPAVPYFSSGPCAKRPGWTPDALLNVPGGLLTGRSHRSRAAKDQLVEVAERYRRLLGIPADYQIALVAGSDTGAFEAALWQLLGPRPVDVFAFDAFGRDWQIDLATQLDLADLRSHVAPFGQLPDLAQAQPDRDLVFTWAGTTAGVRVPDADWLPNESRTGLIFCDAISAIFGLPVPFERMDVISWSWQKGLGGEAQHGMLAFSPRALDRLRSFKPARPLPKIFRLAEWAADDRLFLGDPVNTPSLLCVADALDGLAWAEGIGGLPATIARTTANAKIIADWAARSDWARYLAIDPTIRAPATHCLVPRDPAFQALTEPAQRDFVNRICRTLEHEGAAFDIAGHRDAPPLLRLWTGPTVEAADVAALLPWLDWAYAETMGDLRRG